MDIYAQVHYRALETHVPVEYTHCTYVHEQVSILQIDGQVYMRSLASFFSFCLNNTLVTQQGLL
jgi:hypothetical protein